MAKKKSAKKKPAPKSAPKKNPKRVAAARKAAKERAAKKEARSEAAKRAAETRKKNERAAARKKSAKKNPDTVTGRREITQTTKVTELVEARSNPQAIKRGENLAERRFGPGRGKVFTLKMANASDENRASIKIASISYRSGGTAYSHRLKNPASAIMYGAKSALPCASKKSDAIRRAPVGSVTWGRVEKLIFDCGDRELTMTFEGEGRPYLLVTPSAKGYWIAHSVESWKAATPATRIMVIRSSSKTVAGKRGLHD